MLTPQEVAEHAFAKSAFGGYNMTMVDEFLDELTDDYTALYKENAALKAKLKTLAEKVEEYRATEDSMRSALLAAQKMASNMVSEAEEKKETLLADAEMEARAKIGALHDEIVYEQKRLNAIKASTQNFVAQTRAVCQAQLEQLQSLPDLTPEEIEQTTKEAKVERDAAADIAALGEKIVASYEQRGAEAE
ncbi:MAG: DivIVA domain-containing protein, partial [Oscillospiraceae bacterium]|nr:DivIVA domain-containing protein [Oscillospiraceae bacterium]